MCLFIWQVAVSNDYRGQGIALKMLMWLTNSPECSNVSNIETTVTPSNKASDSLFTAFADIQKTKIKKTPFLQSSHLGSIDHEEEILYKIKLIRGKV